MSYALVFDLASFDRLGASAAGHALARNGRLRYHWQPARAACGVSIPDQTVGRRFEPAHPRACERCRAIVLHLEVPADVR